MLCSEIREPSHDQIVEMPSILNNCKRVCVEEQVSEVQHFQESFS